MAKKSGNLKIASFNLYNLQVPGEKWRRKEYSQKEYNAKIDWTASILQKMNADVIGFQELWSKQSLIDAFTTAELINDYELCFIKDKWYDIAVAAAVRKPWKVSGTEIIKKFPSNFVLKKRKYRRNQDQDREDDEMDIKIDKFSRSLLQLTIKHEDIKKLQFKVFACHLKSKLPTNLDSEEEGKPKIKLHKEALGSAMSTIRRTAEAAALRIVITELTKNTDTPVVVIGDLNDTPLSNTLSIITEKPAFRLYEASGSGSASDIGLYSASQLQQYRSIRDVYFTHEFKGVREILDHVLVSEQFYDHSRNKLWTFKEMKIWNDHIEDGDSATSDHGVVCVEFLKT